MVVVSKKEEFIDMPLGEIAEKTGIALTSWSRWMHGRRSPNLSALKEIADKMGMPLLELIEAFEERRIKTMGKGKDSES